jgi:SWI/SNF-related matrix-associated actin-dependent regulator 1 of chromatin subfamily A
VTPLRPYQQTGIDFLAGRKHALLADDPGAGKSVQVIKAAEKIGADRMIVFCPAIGRISWLDQFQRWQSNGAVTVIWDNDTAKLGLPDGPLNLIVTYDMAALRRDQLIFCLKKAQRFNVAVLDECHYLKSRTAKRTKAVYSPRLDRSRSGILHHLAPEAPVWLLSGTPWPNNFSEFFTHAVTLFPEFCQQIFHHEKPNFGQWIGALCDTRDSGFGPQITGTRKSAIPVIRKSLDPIMLRRRKKDIIPDLAEPQHIDAPIEQKLPKGWDKDMQTMLRSMGWNGSDDSLVDALRLLMATRESISTERQLLGETKAQAAADWIAEYLGNAERGQKVIVFAHHTKVIEVLMEKLAHFGAVRFDGKTSPRDRADAVRQFQEDDRIQCFIGQTIAAGTSITLTAANTVVMVEPDWVPANNEQAIARAHRMGQEKDVFVYWLSVPGTLDHKITAALRRKTRDISATLGDAA